MCAQASRKHCEAEVHAAAHQRLPLLVAITMRRMYMISPTTRPAHRKLPIVMLVISWTCRLKNHSWVCTQEMQNAGDLSRAYVALHRYASPGCPTHPLPAITLLCFRLMPTIRPTNARNSTTQTPKRAVCAAAPCPVSTG